MDVLVNATTSVRRRELKSNCRSTEEVDRVSLEIASNGTRLSWVIFFLLISLSLWSWNWIILDQLLRHRRSSFRSYLSTPPPSIYTCTNIKHPPSPFFDMSSYSAVVETTKTSISDHVILALLGTRGCQVLLISVFSILIAFLLPAVAQWIKKAAGALNLAFQISHIPLSSKLGII